MLECGHEREPVSAAGECETCHAGQALLSFKEKDRGLDRVLHCDRDCLLRLVVAKYQQFSPAIPSHIQSFRANRSSDSMTPPRFQFTIRGLLWATFWVAVWSVCCVALPQEGSVAILGIFGLPILPFVAIGALFGKAKWGLLVGVGAWLLLTVLILILMLSGLMPMPLPMPV